MVDGLERSDAQRIAALEARVAELERGNPTCVCGAYTPKEETYPPPWSCGATYNGWTNIFDKNGMMVCQAATPEAARRILHFATQAIADEKARKEPPVTPKPKREEFPLPWTRQRTGVNDKYLRYAVNDRNGDIVSHCQTAELADRILADQSRLERAEKLVARAREQLRSISGTNNGNYSWDSHYQLLADLREFLCDSAAAVGETPKQECVVGLADLQFRIANLESKVGGMNAPKRTEVGP